MKCPKCNVTLTMSERQGIEIDYCPECRGVWLDRGELDKIIEKSSITSTPYFKKDEDRHEHREYESDKYNKHKKKKSFLDDIFDF